MQWLPILCTNIVPLASQSIADSISLLLLIHWRQVTAFQQQQQQQALGLAAHVLLRLVLETLVPQT